MWQGKVGEKVDVKKLMATRLWILCFLSMLVISYQHPVYAESVTSYDTDTSIGFWGRYVSENEPNPTPPTVVKPDNQGGESKSPTMAGSLPSLNQLTSFYGVFIGGGLLLIVFFSWKKMKNQKIR